MSRTLFVEFRGDGFWAFDVVVRVFLKHLIDAALLRLEEKEEAWLAEPIAAWRLDAVNADLGLFLDESWSQHQIDVFTALAHEACNSLAERESIAADEIESWEMADNLHCFARGLPSVTTASAIRLGNAIVKLVNGSLPAPPPRTWWFFATEECAATMPRRE
ncbi:MAG: hypothetical protein JNL18_20960 [Planctomycetaceae bacterium]|jgi:hypothetical protein|nr:hypothetical protein [Planctomycetaceae bacterium]